MDFLPLLRSKKKAMWDCRNSPEIKEEKRKKLNEHLEMLDYVPWVTKGTILLGVIFGVNWKR